MIVAGIASIPSRERALERTVESLLPQVDRIVVALNGYAQLPQFLVRPEIGVITSPDRGDAGKYETVERCDGYYLSCDDDLIYPPDYAARLITAIEERDRRAVCGFHGGIYTPPYQDPLADRRTLRCLGTVERDQTVDLLGTGALGFHTDTLPVWPGLFRHPNMADVWFAVHARRMGVELVCLAHQEGWLEDINPGGPQIYRSVRHRDGSGRDSRAQQEQQIRRVRWNEPTRRPRFAVAVATCERPGPLLDVLDDLQQQRVDLVVCVFEDCSAGYEHARAACEAIGWSWWRSPERLGKPRHWELVNAELHWMKRLGVDWFVFLPDDVRLQPNALAKAIELWEQLEDPTALSLAHIAAMSGSSWTRAEPRRHNDEAVEVGWIDGLFICHRELLDKIGHRVRPVRGRRWEKRPDLSSGVGGQLSQRLVDQGARLYRVERSLIGFADVASVMNPEDREVFPAVAL